MLTRTLRRVRKLAVGLQLGGHEAAKLVWAAYRLAFQRSPDPQSEKRYVSALVRGQLSPSDFLNELLASNEFATTRTADYVSPLHALHAARVKMVKALPAAETIVDLGGGASQNPAGAMVLMGYPHRFGTLTIVEPPQVQRHEIYQDVAPNDVKTFDTGRGVVNYLYSSMADLSAISDASVDLVFSGESVEHVTREDLVKVLAETRRVLKPSGWFCFDTPNRAITGVQCPDGWINPDHKYEYTHAEVRALLADAGLEVVEEKGISLCPSVKATGKFDVEDLSRNIGIFDQIEDCYLLYYRCRAG